MSPLPRMPMLKMMRVLKPDVFRDTVLDFITSLKRNMLLILDVVVPGPAMIHWKRAPNSRAPVNA